MASYPTQLETTWKDVRCREPPLYEMPHMWQPNLNHVNPYHSSSCDRSYLGWRKWSAHVPDWYASRAEAFSPDWYQRRVDNIRDKDLKGLMWSWEKTSKPTEKAAFGIKREPNRPVQCGYQAVPHTISGQVAMPRWGLYHPPHYEQPSRAEKLPSIFQQPTSADLKHV